MYRHGHMGAPPPMLIPMRLVSSLMIVTHPLVTIMPLKIQVTNITFKESLDSLLF